jgi:hypothetical protein
VSARISNGSSVVANGENGIIKAKEVYQCAHSIRINTQHILNRKSNQ